MIQALHDLFEHDLQDLYSAEKQVTKVLSRFMKLATNPELKQGFETHLDETFRQIERLEEVSRLLKVKITGKKCMGMAGLLEEGNEVAKMNMDPMIKDVALAASAQKVEHYEIAGYGTACDYAKIMGHKDALILLKETIDEEETTDKLLTKISEKLQKRVPLHEKNLG